VRARRPRPQRRDERRVVEDGVEAGVGEHALPVGVRVAVAGGEEAEGELRVVAIQTRADVGTDHRLTPVNGRDTAGSAVPPLTRTCRGPASAARETRRAPDAQLRVAQGVDQHSPRGSANNGVAIGGPGAVRHVGSAARLA
jgi:hypothetical protein